MFLTMVSSWNTISKVICMVAAFYLGRKLGISFGPQKACPTVNPQVVIDSNPCPTAIEAQSTLSTSDPLPSNSYFHRPVHSDDTCPPTSTSSASSFIYKNPYLRLQKDGQGLHADGVLKDVFGYLHHPSCPTHADLVLTSQPISSLGAESEPFPADFTSCQSVYAIRSGSRDDQPCKCIGIVRVPPNEGHVSLQSIMHRTGHIDWPQVLTDQYQDDIVHYYSLAEERNLTSLFLKYRSELISQFLSIMGDPIDSSTGERRTALLLVANQGVLDLVLNFLCSTAAAGIDTSTFIVFLGQSEYKAVIESMGGKAMYHRALGNIPAASAASYADRTFSRVMWLKVGTGTGGREG